MSPGAGPTTAGPTQGRRAYRLGVVGCGQVFERLHLPAIRRCHAFRLTAVCESDARRRSWLEAALPEAARFDSVTSMLAEADLDALLVSTPPDSHADIVLEALRRRHHVLVEKPMATSVAAARAIVHAAREAERAVAVGFNRRFRSTYGALRERLARCADGPARVRFVFQADADRWMKDRVVGSGSTDPPPTGGVSDPETILSDVASHQLDLVPWLTDRSIEAVRAVRRSPSIGRNAVTIDLRLSGDSEAQLQAGYGSGYVEWLQVGRDDRLMTAYPAAIIDPGRIGLTVIGVRKIPAAIERNLARAAEVASLLRRRLIGRPGLTLESIERQLADFAARLSQPGWRSEAGADAEDGMRCAMAVAACLASLQQNGSWQAVDGFRE